MFVILHNVHQVFLYRADPFGNSYMIAYLHLLVAVQPVLFTMMFVPYCRETIEESEQMEE